MKTFRMLDWLVIAATLTGIIYVIAPQQLPVTLYKLSLISIAAVVGYWIDRSLFPYARPDVFLNDGPADVAFSAAQLRRAIIVAACVIGVALGA